MSFSLLHKTLNQRKRPEDISEMILKLLGSDLTRKEVRILNKAARGSLKRSWYGYTSMLQDFGKVIGAESNITKAIEIFQLKIDHSIDYDKVEDIRTKRSRNNPV